MIRYAIGAAIFFLTASASLAQQAATSPKTELEKFNGEVGTVVIKGYTSLGTVSGVEVTAMTLRSAASGQTRSGVLIEVSSGGTTKRTSRSYIDYDEIAPLLNGIAFVAKTDASATKLKFFEGIYSTKGDLKVTVFNNENGSRNVAVQSGSIGSATTFMSFEQLDRLQALIREAKDMLDKSQS
jgi:hypothetical protein